MSTQRETYFAADGTYGDATDLIVVRTDDFTEEEWGEVDAADDWSRSRVANSLRYRKDHQ